MNLLIMAGLLVVVYFAFSKQTPAPDKFTGNQIYDVNKFDIDINSNLRSIPVKRIVSIIAIESNGDPNARGVAGERGLMQITIDAMIQVNKLYGYSFKFDDMFDPGNNITVGSAYLDYLRNQLFHDLDSGTRAYNVGLYSVQVNPQLGTGYLNKVLNYENSLSIT